MTLKPQTHTLGVLNIELLPGQHMRIAPQAFFYSDAAVCLRKQWRRGVFSRLGHLLTGQHVFETLAVNSGSEPAQLRLYQGAHGCAVPVAPQAALLWNKQAFVAASPGLEAVAFVNRRLPYGDLGIEKSKGLGIVYLKAEHPLIEHSLEEGQSCFISPQSWLAGTFPMRFALKRTLQARFLLQVWGPATLYVSPGPEEPPILRPTPRRPWSRV